MSKIKILILETTHSCGTQTDFGVPVVPEVNMTYASASSFLRSTLPWSEQLTKSIRLRALYEEEEEGIPSNELYYLSAITQQDNGDVTLFNFSMQWLKC